MTVEEFLDAAKAVGWEHTTTYRAWRSAPFCRSDIVRVFVLRFTDPSGDVRMKELWCVDDHYPRTSEYTKRFLTEMRKHNEKVFALLPEAKECQGLVEVLRYCS
jgi:hypothetical protein